MKKLTVILLLSLFLSTSVSASASGWDISDLLGKVSSATASDSTKTGSSKGGGLGDLLSGVANALGVGSSKLTVEKMVGTWKYVNPAVSFKSDNFLLKAGGAAAAQQVEAKLAPYYKTAGLTSLVMTINADSTFTFKARMMTLGGTITKDAESGNFIFNFKAFKKIKVGSTDGSRDLHGNRMELPLDVTQLMTLAENSGSLSGNSTIKGLTAILQQYDGMTAGFELQRQN